MNSKKRLPSPRISRRSNEATWIEDAHEAQKLDHLLWLMEVALYKMEVGASVCLVSWDVWSPHGVEIDLSSEALPPIQPLDTNLHSADLQAIDEVIFQIGLRG